MDRSFPEAYGALGPVRELSDGRVMVADPLGQVLAILDFQTGTADTIGRPGAGPQEYGQPDAVFPLKGDTTLLVDLGNARLTTVAPDGIFLRTLPMGQETTSGRLIVTLPRGVDRNGRLYFRSERQPAGPSPDSTAILRFDPDTRILDTLAMIRIPPLGPPPLPGGGGSRSRIAQAQDDWSVGPDGRLAVVRCGDYSVTWISPRGDVLEGLPTGFERVRIREREKEKWVEEKALSQISMRADESGTVRIFRGGGNDVPNASDGFEWPSTFPPFKPGRTGVTAEGELWVERFVPAGENPLIDRFDRSGRKIGEIRLPTGRRVVGFGREAVFLARTDEFGLQWVERYSLRGP